MRGKSSTSNLKEGDVFSELTYIKQVGSYKNNAVGQFKCSCGVVCEKIISNVVHGTTKSCGCVLEGTGNRARAKTTYLDEKKEGFFDVDAFYRSDFILQS